MFKLPTLGGGPSSGGGGFVLPKLGSGSSSLADYANAQLNGLNQAEGKLFTIPKLFPSSNISVPVKTEPEKMPIDLKSALVPETEQKKITRVPKVKPTAEAFIPQFIDCDIGMEVTPYSLLLDDNFERFTLHQMRAQTSDFSFTKFSVVGKIIRCRFKKKRPKIIHGYEHKHKIKTFAFDTPSPDDKILAHLNKNKN